MPNAAAKWSILFGAMKRALLAAAFSLALLWAAQLRDLEARLELVTEPRMPVRVYLFKDDRPFRLSPVQALLPLNVDLFYRERLWTSGPSPETLEVTCNEQSHFMLLNGRASFDLPAGRYRVRGVPRPLLCSRRRRLRTEGR